MIPYPEGKYAPPKGLIPLMAVLQAKKQKVRLVMDYRELNKYIDVHTANADVCVQKLREWRQKGSNVAVLDLCWAYLQVHVDKSLWPFQTVRKLDPGHFSHITVQHKCLYLRNVS